MKIIDWHISLILISSVLIATLFCINLDDLMAKDIGNTNSMIDTTHRFTDAELDSLESKLKSDPNYNWKLLSGDRKKVIPLILASQKRKQTNTIWYHLIEMCFAADQGEARHLPIEERRSRYAYALEYLKKSLQTLQTITKASVDMKELAFYLESLKMNIAIASLEMGDLESARRLAKESLKNNTDTNSWNYGNVIHWANTILGRVALRKNDLDDAKMYFLESAKTPGSPQLNSFGPSFILARELLKKGEKIEVLEYLDLVGKFWANPKKRDPSNHNSVRVAQERAEKLSKWKNEIMKGNIPQDRKWR